MQPRVHLSLLFADLQRGSYRPQLANLSTCHVDADLELQIWQ